ncbi:cuticle protein CP14.6 [Fopius arisanus]|uniref:Cuticle protein CP14.6 n=2 Tax=Fopius arisanus TaxID=64838 RepID=A0A9R1TNK3_9HYME|nr:PREDICTED: cuticle protein CP14.6-like [Fopius arisanus]
MILAAKLMVMGVLVAMASSAPAGDNSTPPPIVIVRQSQDGPNPDGSYSYSYETSNGINVQEQGSQQPSSNPDSEYKEANTVHGSYTYPDENGNLIQVTYTAGENGFQPEGAHLPVAPAVPEAILKALEWIAAHPEEDKLQ